MTDEEELACANLLIGWLKDIQASGAVVSLNALSPSRLVKMAWGFVRCGIHTRHDLESHLTAQMMEESAMARRNAEIDAAWADRHTQHHKNAVQKAFL